MDAKASSKSRSSSRHVTEGPERAPHRSSYYAMGLTRERTAAVFKRTPYVADLKRGGRYVAKDMFEADGIPLLMKTLLDHGHLHGDRMTVTGRTIADDLERVRWNSDQDVVHPANRPLLPTGGVVGLQGDLAPEGAIVKVAGMKEVALSGPARCFDGGAFGSGYVWKYAQQVGPAREGAVTHPGRAREQACYADL